MSVNAAICCACLTVSDPVYRFQAQVQVERITSSYVTEESLDLMVVMVVSFYYPITKTAK